LLLNIPPDKRGLIHHNDSVNLMLFNQRINNTFRTNLLKKASISSKQNKSKAALANLIDGSSRTYWSTKKDFTTATIEIKLDKEQTFDRLVLQENIQEGQRVESFKLLVSLNGKWTCIAEGKTIGYKRILCFEKTMARNVRLEIMSSRSNPQLSELGLYNSAL